MGIKKSIKEAVKEVKASRVHKKRLKVAEKTAKKYKKETQREYELRHAALEIQQSKIPQKGGRKKKTFLGELSQRVDETRTASKKIMTPLTKTGEYARDVSWGLSQFNEVGVLPRKESPAEYKRRRASGKKQKSSGKETPEEYAARRESLKRKGKKSKKKYIGQEDMGQLSSDLAFEVI